MHYVVQTTQGYDRVIAQCYHVADAQDIVDAFRNDRRTRNGFVVSWRVVQAEDLHTLKLTLLTAAQLRRLQHLDL